MATTDQLNQLKVISLLQHYCKIGKKIVNCKLQESWKNKVIRTFYVGLQRLRVFFGGTGSDTDSIIRNLTTDLTAKMEYFIENCFELSTR